ncbi:Carbon-nitrogen hydrolase [[Neocosmospora] mangrovei]
MTQFKQKHVRVAVTQAEPIWLDLAGTVQKTCDLITEAASTGAEIISFPECWLSGYPAWIWDRPVDPELAARYIRNSLVVESAEMERIRECAAANKIIVALGFSESRHGSLYISQAIIGADGQILTLRSKIKATHMERTIFGDATAECLDSVVDTPLGRIGALSCWEHVQPLLKYHTYSQREQIHIAAWPPVFDHDGKSLWSMSREGTEAIARTYAIESQSFVLHTTAVISESGIDQMNTHNGLVMNSPGGGYSAVFGPDGRKLSTNIPSDKEGIIYADLDIDDILHSKAFLDVVGHYSRPDLLWLGVDPVVKAQVKL